MIVEPTYRYRSWEGFCLGRYEYLNDPLLRNYITKNWPQWPQEAKVQFKQGIRHGLSERTVPIRSPFYERQET